MCNIIKKLGFNLLSYFFEMIKYGMVFCCLLLLWGILWNAFKGCLLQ